MQLLTALLLVHKISISASSSVPNPCKKNNQVNLMLFWILLTKNINFHDKKYHQIILSFSKILKFVCLMYVLEKLRTLVWLGDRFILKITVRSLCVTYFLA